MTNSIQIEIRNVYGEEKAYPVCHAGQRFAAIAGTKTLTRNTMVNVLAIGFAIQVVDRYGNVSRTFEAGKINNLPMVA